MAGLTNRNSNNLCSLSLLTINLNTTYAQHGLANIAKKKRELKSFQNQLFEEIFDVYPKK